MANKHQADGFEQDEHGWYREPPFPVEQLFDAVDFGDDLIYDPSCGIGNILDVAKTRGHPTIGSDIVTRGARHRFYRGNFLNLTRWPTMPDRRLSIVNNPPYNVPPGAAESFIHKAIDAVPFHRAAFLLPIEFLCGVGRYQRLFSKTPPSHVVYCSQRPSMPPGAEIEALGDKAFKGGKADYCWIIFTAGGPHRTESRWLHPSTSPADPLSERRARRGSLLPSVSA
jgi:hypothetical protein